MKPSWQIEEEREARRKQAMLNKGINPETSKSRVKVSPRPQSPEFTPKNLRGAQEDEHGRKLSVSDWRQECREL